MVTQELEEYKKEIQEYITGFLKKSSDKYSRFPLDKDLFSRLSGFSVSGKMYRGGILIYIYELLTEAKDIKPAVLAASALELFEAGILIQDDVMDQDDLRRGRPSLRVYFRDFAPKIDVSKKSVFGDSVAMCTGDIAYFLSYEILNSIDVPQKTKTLLFEEFSREMSLLCLSQVQDMYLSSTLNNVSEKETLEMYAGKTARYTWILPLQIALALSGNKTKYGRDFERIGSLAGVIYQLVDDRIGLYEDEIKIGKSVGGDLKEGKKTMYWHHTRSSLTGSDLAEFENLYGKKDLSLSEIETVKNLIKKSGAYDKNEELISGYLEDIKKQVGQLDLTDKQKKSLLDLVYFISHRNK